MVRNDMGVRPSLIAQLDMLSPGAGTVDSDDLKSFAKACGFESLPGDNKCFMSRKKSSIVHSISDSELISLAIEMSSIRKICLKLNVKSGSLYPVVKQRLCELGFREKFSCSQPWNKGKIDYALDVVFSENSRFDTDYVKKHFLKTVPYECDECKISSWNNQKLTLELDHINGVSNDQRIENIRLLCPNCHSQTLTFRGRNIKKTKTTVSDEILLHALKTTSSIRAALIKVGMSPKGGNYNRCYQLLATQI